MQQTTRRVKGQVCFRVVAEGGTLAVGVAKDAVAGPLLYACPVMPPPHESEWTASAVQTRHIGNNWVLLLSLALLFLVSGAMSMVAERGNGADARFFVVGSLLVGAVNTIWLWRNPSWFLAPRHHYFYLIGGTFLGIFLSALMPFMHGAGPWLVLGAAIIVYGLFERLRLLMTVGGAVTVTALLAMAIHAEVWGGALHIVTTAVLAFAANKLYELRHGRRREAQDSAPDFIGSFEEFDPEEALRP